MTKRVHLSPFLSLPPPGSRLPLALQTSLTAHLVLSLPTCDRSETLAVWTRCKDDFNFRPKLGALGDVLCGAKGAPRDGLLELCLGEYARACQAESSRKAFEGTARVVVQLVSWGLGDDECGRLARGILNSVVFVKGEAEELVEACGSPRYLLEVQNKGSKATNQINWRQVFWKEIACEIANGELSANAAVFLCRQFKRVEEVRASVFWFELLFLCTKPSATVYSSTDNALEICRELLNEGAAYYSPTSEQDSIGLSTWFEFALDRFGFECFELVQSTIRLDYRAVEPFFEKLLDVTGLNSDRRSRCEVALAIFESFVETRRVPLFIQMLMGPTSTVPFTWFENDLQLYIWFRNRACKIAQNGITEYQSPQIWPAFLQNANENELALCLFEAFASSVQWHTEIEAETCFRHSSSAIKLSREFFQRSTSAPTKYSPSLMISHAFLLRACTLLMRSASNVPEGIKTDDVKLCKTLYDALPQPSKIDLLVELRNQLAMTAFVVAADAAKIDESADWTFEALLKNPNRDRTADLALQILLHPKFDWKQARCDLIWSLVFDLNTNSAFAVVLQRPEFYEIHALRDSFQSCALGATEKNANQILRLAAQFPSGYIELETVQVLIDATFSTGGTSTLKSSSSAMSKAAFLQAVCRTNENLVLSAFPNPQELLAFFTAVQPMYETKQFNEVSPAVSTLVRYFVNVVHDVDHLQFVVDALVAADQEALLAIVMDTLALRLVVNIESKSGENKPLVKLAKHLAKFACERETVSLRLFGGALNIFRSFAELANAGHKIKMKEQTPIAIGTCLEIAFRHLASDNTLDFEQANGFVVACCESFSLFSPEFPDQAYTILAACALFLNDKDEPMAFENILKKAGPHHVALILDSLCADAWKASDARARLYAARGFATFFKFGVRKAYEHVVDRRRNALFTAVLNIISRDDLDQAWNALISFVMCKSLCDALTSRDVIVALGAFSQSTNLLKIRFLHALCEFKSDSVLGASSAFARVLASVERDILSATIDPEIAARKAGELVRVCKSLKPLEIAFRHHAASVLADHITLCFFKGTPHEVLRRPLELIAFHLLDLCGEHELQQLHAVLGGGVGGARRDVLKRLVADHQKRHVFKGKT